MFSPWRVEPSSMKAGLLTVKFERWVRQQPFYDYNIIRPPIQFMFILLLVAISRWFRSTGPAHIREPRGPSPINSPAPLFTRLHTSEEMEWNLVYVQLTFIYVYSFMLQHSNSKDKTQIQYAMNTTQLADQQWRCNLKSHQLLLDRLRNCSGHRHRHHITTCGRANQPRE